MAIFAAVAATMIVIGVWTLDQQIHQVVRATHERFLLTVVQPLEARLKQRGITGLSDGRLPVLPNPLHSAGGTIRYAVLDATGEMLASSPNAPPSLPQLDFISQVSAEFEVDVGDLHLWGVSRRVDTPDGAVILQVAQDMSSVFVVLDDVPRAAFWPIVIALGGGAILLFLANLILTRMLLRPLRQAASDAAAIGPAGGRRRIGEEGMPNEILPLIRAVNGALDRTDEVMRRQRRFNQDVAHELRTPLAILTSELDLLEDKDVAKRFRSDVEALTAIVGQLLEAAEAAPGTPDEPVDLALICSESAARLQNTASQFGRSIRLELPQDDVKVLGQAAALRRAVHNLLDNALTHSPMGSEVILRLAPPAIVEVADCGPGVPEAQKSKVFERFWRADRGHRRGGSGIGLALVAEIAAQHGGTVGVRDRDGGGAIFALSLPRADAKYGHG
ncbi:MAG: sensor histidine kinase [Roseomonas sp.]